MRSSISMHDNKRRLGAAAAILFTLALVPHTALSAASQGGATGKAIGPQGAIPAGTQTVRKHYIAAEDGRCLRVVTAGVRTRNALPAPPLTGGVITLPAVLTPANIVWAGLYWVILDSGPTPNLVALNGSPVAPVSLGVTPSPCWPEPFASAYFADVTSLVVPGANTVVGLDDSGIMGGPFESEGASLVVIYASEQQGACEIIVMDGNDATVLGGACGSSVTNFLPVTCPPGVPANLYFIGADGQGPAAGGFVDNQIWNGVPLGDGDDFDGSDPAAPTAPPPGPDFAWDTDATPGGWPVAVAPPFAASVDAPVDPAGTPCDCVNWIATVLEVGVRDCLPVGVEQKTWEGMKKLYK